MCCSFQHSGFRVLLASYEQPIWGTRRTGKTPPIVVEGDTHVADRLLSSLNPAAVIDVWKRTHSTSWSEKQD